MDGSKQFPTKSFKLTSGNRKVGIIATSFKELKEKCASKFNLEERNIILTLKDGTEIDGDFFEVLENNEELLIGGFQPPIIQILDSLESFLYEEKEVEVNCRLQEILQNKNVIKWIKSLISLNITSEKSQKNLRLEDPHWFEGLDTRYITKQAVLKTSAEGRMRGYFHKFKKDLELYKENNSLKYLLNEIHKKLRNKRFNSAYFDRSALLDERLCDEKGLFLCCGEFIREDCPYHHQINPYNSREERILFSTWNFDHIIEMSRSIIPAVKTAITVDPSDFRLNIDYLFELMFEHHRRVSPYDKRGNLKLVHIVCHDKAPHKLDCDLQKLHESQMPLCKKMKL